MASSAGSTRMTIVSRRRMIGFAPAPHVTRTLTLTHVWIDAEHKGAAVSAESDTSASAAPPDASAGRADDAAPVHHSCYPLAAVVCEGVVAVTDTHTHVSATPRDRTRAGNAAVSPASRLSIVPMLAALVQDIVTASPGAVAAWSRRKCMEERSCGLVVVNGRQLRWHEPRDHFEPVELTSTLLPCAGSCLACAPATAWAHDDAGGAASVVAVGTVNGVFVFQVRHGLPHDPLRALCRPTLVVKPGLPLHMLPSFMVGAVEFSPDGALLAVAAVDGHVGVWNTEDLARDGGNAAALVHGVVPARPIDLACFRHLDVGSALAIGCADGSAYVYMPADIRVRRSPATALDHTPLMQCARLRGSSVSWNGWQVLSKRGVVPIPAPSASATPSAGDVDPAFPEDIEPTPTLSPSSNGGTKAPLPRLHLRPLAPAYVDWPITAQSPGNTHDGPPAPRMPPLLIAQGHHLHAVHLCRTTESAGERESEEAMRAVYNAIPAASDSYELAVGVQAVMQAEPNGHATALVCLASGAILTVDVAPPEDA